VIMEKGAEEDDCALPTPKAALKEEEERQEHWYRQLVVGFIVTVAAMGEDGFVHSTITV